MRQRDRMWNQYQRDETDVERLDRNFSELLQELRVAQAGVQILFAFLLTLPFTQRFEQLRGLERGLYLATLLLSAAAVALLTAPVAYHRLVFRRHAKEQLVEASNLLAIAGLAVLAVDISAVILLITSVVVGGVLPVLLTVATAAVFLLLWVGVPLAGRFQQSNGSADNSEERLDDDRA